MKPIYLDANATTPLLPEVRAAMEPYEQQVFGNPASAHAFGRQARQALEDARERIAELLGAKPGEVLFTSGATESNNMALLGLADAAPGHLLVSPVEHPSVLEPARQRPGADLQFLEVDRQGRVAPDDLRQRLRPDTRLVAVQLVNHEMGAIQPVRELVDVLPRSIPLHCDAVQAVGRMSVRFRDLCVATLSASAHKFHGPKGVGVLLVRQGTHLRPRIWGGHQQQGRRPGTEPVALAVGMARALELWHQHHESRWARIGWLRREFLNALADKGAPFVLNGPSDGMPHTINVSFPGCASDSLLINLDLVGVACSTGSACSSGSLLPSPVLQAMRLEHVESAMRFSLNFLLSEEDVRAAAQRIGDCVHRLRHRALEQGGEPFRA